MHDTNALTLPLRSGPQVDELYAELIAAQADLNDEAAADWLARLTLILCQHIGDAGVLRQAFALARDPSSAPLARDPSVDPLARDPCAATLALDPSAAVPARGLTGKQGHD